jgi:hypothetical protein
MCLCDAFNDTISERTSIIPLLELHDMKQGYFLLQFCSGYWIWGHNTCDKASDIFNLSLFIVMFLKVNFLEKCNGDGNMALGERKYCLFNVYNYFHPKMMVPYIWIWVHLPKSSPLYIIQIWNVIGKTVSSGTPSKKENNGIF